jgi:hypothetical protein
MSLAATVSLTLLLRLAGFGRWWRIDELLKGFVKLRGHNETGLAFGMGAISGSRLYSAVGRKNKMRLLNTAARTLKSRREIPSCPQSVGGYPGGAARLVTKPPMDSA